MDMHTRWTKAEAEGDEIDGKRKPLGSREKGQETPDQRVCSFVVLVDDAGLRRATSLSCASRSRRPPPEPHGIPPPVFPGGAPGCLAGSEPRL